MARRKRHIASRAAVFLGLVALGALLGYGYHRASLMQVVAVDVRGNVHAEAADLVALAAIPDSSRLFDLDTAEIVRRVEEHPWVRTAAISRWMTGTVSISVAERQPVALAIGPDGRPAMYLDVDGFAMPVTRTALRAGYDVPLLTGRLPAVNPAAPLADAPLRRLLAALASTGPSTDALIAAIERRPDGQMVLFTAPAPGGTSIPVSLGRDRFEEKLHRLEAFWEQAVLVRPERAIRRIDLRHEGQIVTEES
jgi:cell division protein FtsQ